MLPESWPFRQNRALCFNVLILTAQDLLNLLRWNNGRPFSQNWGHRWPLKFSRSNVENAFWGVPIVHGPAFWNQNILIKGFQKRVGPLYETLAKNLIAAAVAKCCSLSRCLPRTKSILVWKVANINQQQLKIEWQKVKMARIHEIVNFHLFCNDFRQRP